MSPATWTPTELESKSFILASEVWRCISPESKRPLINLVGSPNEVELLEELLELSAAPQPSEFEGYSTVISGPFKRRVKTHPGNRFRAVGDSGVFYSAFDIRTALCEYSWHQAKFRSQSEGLDNVKAIPMQIFSVDVKISVLDLSHKFFDKTRSALLSKTEYAESQHFAKSVRESKVMGVKYESVRNKQGGECLAIFSLTGIMSKEPSFHDGNWWLSFTGNTAYVQHDRLVGSGAEYAFSFELE